MNSRSRRPRRPLPRSLGKGRYTLIEQLGRGGIATVWRALDSVLGTERALKLLDDEAGRSPVFRSRFLTEARVMSRLVHPHILRVHDYGHEHGRFWLVMDLVDGGSVADLVRETAAPLSPERALSIAFDVLSALVVVHDSGAIHRDVKPGNILIADDGTALLSDFGIVRIHDQPLLHQTSHGDAMGTVGYMAPEQRRDPTSITGVADLYGVGATLFATLTRRHPKVLDSLDKHPEYLQDLPPPVVELVDRSTRRTLSERFDDARSMALATVRAFDAVTSGPSVEGTWMLRLDDAHHRTMNHVRAQATRTPAPVRRRAPTSDSKRRRVAPSVVARRSMVQSLTLLFGIATAVIAVVVIALLVFR